MFERFLGRIEEKARIASSAPVVIVALGDSVTQGCMEAGAIDHQGVYHNVLKKMLERRFPATTFCVVNAGVGGESAAGGIKRLGRDVLAHSPDLLIIGFCLNDSCGGLDSLPSYKANIREIIEKAKAGTSADIVVLTPNFMASRETSRIAPEHKKFAKTIIGCQRDGVLKAFASALKETAASLGVPVADVYAKWELMAARGVDVDAKLVNGLNHPDRAGQRLIARTIMALVEAKP